MVRIAWKSTDYFEVQVFREFVLEDLLKEACRAAFHSYQIKVAVIAVHNAVLIKLELVCWRRRKRRNLFGSDLKAVRELQASLFHSLTCESHGRLVKKYEEHVSLLASTQ